MTSMSGAGATASAEVEITTVGGLTDFSSAMKSRSATLASELADLRLQFTNKASGNEGKAIDQYLATMKGFEDALYEQFPAAINEFAGAFDSYVDEIAGLGFSADDDLRTSSVDLARYKAKVTNEGSDQKNEAEDRIKDVKTVLEKVAAEVADYESPASQLNSQEDSIKNFLDGIGTAIDSVHNGLLDAKSGFVSKLDAFNSTLDGFSGVMNRIQFFSDPNSGFSPANMKAMISSEKMTAENMSDYFNAATSVSDSQAIYYHLTGQYNEFFNMDPNQLSETTYYAVSDDMVDYIIAGDEKFIAKLEEGLNVLLGKPDDVSNTFLNNLILGGEKVAYLAYATAIAIDPDLINKNPEAAARYNKAKDRVDNAYLLTDLFYGIMVADAYRERVTTLGFEHTVDDVATPNGSPQVRNTKIKDLSLKDDKTGFSFNAYQETTYGVGGPEIESLRGKEIKYHTTELPNGSLKTNEELAKVNQLREERAKLFNNWVNDISKSALSLVPYGTALLELSAAAEHFGRGDSAKALSGTTTALSEALDSASKSKTSAAFSALSDTINLVNANNDLSEEIAKADEKASLSLFKNEGFKVSQGEDTYLAGYHKYDINAYNNRVTWEATGSREVIEEMVTIDARKSGYTFTDAQQEIVREKAIDAVKEFKGVSKAEATKYVDFVLQGQASAPDLSIEKMGVDSYVAVKDEIVSRYYKIVD